MEDKEVNRAVQTDGKSFHLLEKHFQECMAVADARNGYARWIETLEKGEILMHDSSGERPLVKQFVDVDRS